MVETGFDQNEPRAYLSFLLEHEDGCATESCPFCMHVKQLYDLIRYRFLGGGGPHGFPPDLTTRIQ